MDACADLNGLLLPLEDFTSLHARTLRAAGRQVIDLSFPNPRQSTDPRGYDNLRDIAAAVGVGDLQYTPLGGLTRTRRRIATVLAGRFQLPFGYRDIILTQGATAALNVVLQCLFGKRDQVMLITPMWMDYPVYLSRLGVGTVVVPSAPDKHLDIEAISSAWTPATRALLLSQPNCPTGVVYTTRELGQLADFMAEVSKASDRPALLISDETHRDTTWSGASCQSPLCAYADSISVYSFGKAWSMQGMHIGYIAISPRLSGRETVRELLERGLRAAGYGGPATIMQLLAERLAGLAPDMMRLGNEQSIIRAGLDDIGYEVVQAQATVFVYVRCPDEDAIQFVTRAARRGLLVMPSTIFHETGYFRIALNGGTDLERALARLADCFAGA